MLIRTRKLLMAGLVASFIGQTALVYGDETALSTPALTPLEQQGRQVWHDHNCQVCHQFYGFGGFLGPDLTNAARRLTRERLDAILTVGATQMPAFHFDAETIDAVEAFLRAMDRTGIGQARHVIPADAAQISQAIDEQAGDLPLSGDALAGRELFEQRCISCHTLFRSTPLGPFLAADLSSVHDRLSADEIEQVMVNGRPLKGMPPTGLEDDERRQIRSFFGWLSLHRDGLLKRVGGLGETVDLPWWEFR